ncbi:MAG: hypothetical protein AAFS10_12640, partial [Myxococcota bacterium]
TPEVYQSWQAFSNLLVQITPQIQAGEVEPTLQTQAAERAQAFFERMKEETRGQARPLGATHGSSTTHNPYTDEMVTVAPFYHDTAGAGPDIADQIRNGNWERAMRSYRTLALGLDQWIAKRLEDQQGEHSEEARGARYMGAMRNELDAIREHDPIRVAAVFHPDDKYEETGQIHEVPLSLYIWREGNRWKLKDLTNPENTFEDDVPATDDQTEPPHALFEELNTKIHFPKGIIRYQIPDGRGGTVITEERTTLAEWLTYIGLGLAAVGLGLVTFGTGTVAVGGAWVLAASGVVGAGAGVADLVERGDHGNLNTTTVALNLLQIVAGLSGAGAIASGRIVVTASQAAMRGSAYTGTMARIAGFADKAFIPLTATAMGADALQLAILTPQTIAQLEAIEQGSGSQEDKDRAKLLLLAQLAATGGLFVLSVRGDLPTLRSGGRNLYIDVVDGLPVARMEPFSVESQRNLAMVDAEQNTLHVQNEAYEASTNEWLREIHGVALSVNQRQALLEEAGQLGIDLRRLRKDIAQRTRGASEADTINLSFERLNELLQAARTGMTTNAQYLTRQLGVEADTAENLIHHCMGHHYSSHQIDQTLKAIHDTPDTRRAFQALSSFEEQSAFLLRHLREGNVQGSMVNLEPGMFEANTRFTEEQVDPIVAEGAARAQQEGSTIDANRYVERHFTPATMEYIASRPDMPIYVYEGNVQSAMADLESRGFNQVQRLSDNANTDFHKYTAINPETGQEAFVIVGASGDAYQREIAAHFLYHDPPIPARRIIHMRVEGGQAARQEFITTLERIDVDPDVIIMGNVEELRGKLADRNIEPAREINASNLYGFIYEIDGKTVMSLKVEPYLYADRAGQFVEAVNELNSRDRAIIFTGTAGGLSDNMQINDMVAPSTFNDANGLENRPVAGIENHATPYFEGHG